MRIVNAKHRLLVETLLIFASCEAILMWLLPRFLPDLQSGWAATSDVTLLTLTAGALLWWRFSRHYQIAEIRRRAEAEQWAAELRQVNTTLQSRSRRTRERPGVSSRRGGESPDPGVHQRGPGTPVRPLEPRG
ncbi:MAG: hypothetical protein V9H26_07590 [Verrucomicrobiota bacterium]